MKVPQENEARLARERLDSECEMMERRIKRLPNSKDELAVEVHAIRKLGKSLRGGFSLFRLGKFASLDIRAISRLLAEPRNAVARLNTWNTLRWNGDTTQAVAITALLEQKSLSATRCPPPEAILWCLQRVESARRQLLNSPKNNLAEITAEGLKNLQKRALRRCRKLDSCSDKAFHQARKSLKAWLGAAALLPDELHPMRHRLHHLAELLGDENDLATLAFWLDSHGFTARLAPDLWQSLMVKHREIQAEVIRHNKKLLSLVK